MFIPKISQNQYINTFNKAIYKKLRKQFEDPTRDLLETKVEVSVFRIGILPNKTA